MPDNKYIVQHHDSSLKKRKKHGRKSDEKHDGSKRVKVSEDEDREVRKTGDPVSKIEL